MCDCMNGDPVPGDPRFQYANQWQTGMMEAPCSNPLCFLGSLVCHWCDAALVVLLLMTLELCSWCNVGHENFCGHNKN